VDRVDYGLIVKLVRRIFMAKEDTGDMTVREAGHRGGIKVRDKHGREFYAEIGKKGGEAVRDEHGHEYYEEIGEKGGQRVRELVQEGKEKEENNKLDS